MSNVLDALQALVDNGLEGSALDTAIENLLENNNFEDSDDQRLLVALAWSRDQGNDTAPEEIESASYGENTICIAGNDYLVLTDDEADEACKERIADSLWAFNADFLSGETGIDKDVFEALADKCEGANDAIRSIIDGSCGLDDFASTAASADGRGNFLSPYDGEEQEYCASEWFYLYQQS